jgi:hypothetical protein
LLYQADIPKVTGKPNNAWLTLDNLFRHLDGRDIQIGFQKTCFLRERTQIRAQGTNGIRGVAIPRIDGNKQYDAGRVHLCCIRANAP